MLRPVSRFAQELASTSTETTHRHSVVTAEVDDELVQLLGHVKGGARWANKASIGSVVRKSRGSSSPNEG